MKTNKLAVLGCLALGLTSFSVACGESGNEPPPADSDSGDDSTSSSSSSDDSSGDGDSDSDSGDGDTTTTTTTGDGDCGTNVEGGLENGDACADNEDCFSNFCLGYSDAPEDPDAVCEPQPADCHTRVVGQILEFGTGNPVAGADLRVVGAIGASVNPVGAPAYAEGSTDDMGRYDLTSNAVVEEPLGIVGIVQGDGYYLSATGLASPIEGNSYGPANEIRDLWAVPEASVTAWNAALSGDAEIAEELPVGEKGGVIGLARSRETGVPQAGITMQSVDPDSSGAFIRYLNEAGDAFDGTETSSNGIFIILNPGLGEQFDAYAGGELTDAPTGTAGSTNNSLFILIMGV